MKTTHLFKADDRYYAKSTIESAHVEYEYTFDKTFQKEMYPWYVYMRKPWGQDSYEQADWKHTNSYGMVHYDRYKKTIGGWDEGPSGDFPIQKTETFRQLKITSVTVVVTIRGGKQLRYDVSNTEDKLFEGAHGSEKCYDATTINDIYRIYNETDRERSGYYYPAGTGRHQPGSNPEFIKMSEPLALNCNTFNVLIDDAVDIYELERVTIEKLVEQYAQENLDHFVERYL